MNTKLAAARLWLSNRHPYLSTALWALVPVEKKGLGTLAVDKYWRLYYDPEFVESTVIDVLGGVLYHEVSHLIRGHHERGEAIGAHPIVFNWACDLEINDDLKREVSLPREILLPKTFGLKEGLLAEEYYEELSKRFNTGPGPRSGKGPSEQEDGPYPPGSGSRPDPARGRCGSCAHGAQEPWEEPAPSSGGPRGVDSVDADLIRRDVAERIKESIKSRGNVPEHWRRWVEEYGAPRVDWRKEFRTLVRNAVAEVMGAADYSYRRPSRRSGVVTRDILLPGTVQRIPEVAVVVDTSGSMSDRELEVALWEIRNIIRALGGRDVTVLSCDTEVHTCARVFRPEQVKMVGGGGTDMGEGINAAMKLRPRPQVVIVLTDGYTPWPSSPPPAKVVVGIIGALGAQGETPPTWARHVKIEVGR